MSSASSQACDTGKVVPSGRVSCVDNVGQVAPTKNKVKQPKKRDLNGGMSLRSEHSGQRAQKVSSSS